jgi:hypothetical protein
VHAREPGFGAEPGAQGAGLRLARAFQAQGRPSPWGDPDAGEPDPEPRTKEIQIDPGRVGLAKFTYKVAV